MYEEFNDNELLYMIRKRDDTALHILIKKYEHIAKFLIYDYLGRFHDEEEWADEYQLSMLKLLQAIDYYREDKHASFHHYYLWILKFSLVDKYRDHCSKQGELRYGTLSLDMQIGDEAADYQLSNFISKIDSEPISLAVRERYYKARALLNASEREVLDLRAIGYTYKQIGNKLNINIKKVAYILHKARFVK